MQMAPASLRQLTSHPHGKKGTLTALVRSLSICLSIIALLFPSTSSLAQTYTNQKVTTIPSQPWAFTFLTENQIIWTEKRGDIRSHDLSTGKTTLLHEKKVLNSGQGGLLDLALSPNFASDKTIYFTYSKPSTVDADEAATTLASAVLMGGKLVGWKDLLITKSLSDSGRHYGSRIAFDDQGHVYFSVGDRGHRPNGQDLTTHAGSIIRLNLDGSIPIDNPFVGKRNALPEIWSYGHRNPQGLVFDSSHKRLWTIEHGPRGGDELNLVHKGANYGWAVISYGKEYWNPLPVGEGTEREGMEQPVKYWVPSIAPGSLLLYTGKQYPQWQGKLFAGALKLTHLNRITLDSQGSFVGEERLFDNKGLRIRALAQSPDGFLYFATDAGDLYKVIKQSK